MLTKSLKVTTVFAVSAVLALACGDTGPPWELRAISEGMRLSVTSDSLPPHAEDDVLWRLQVRDAKTGLPVEGGQGAVWARNKDGHEVKWAVTQAPELGVYYGKMKLVMAGQWQMGVVFRRDSTSPLATIDWVQEVRKPRPLGG